MQLTHTHRYGQYNYLLQAAYEADGDMYAVCYEGPRDMRVRRKQKPDIQSSTVSTDVQLVNASHCMLARLLCTHDELAYKKFECSSMSESR